MPPHQSSMGAQGAQKSSGVDLLKHKGASAQMWEFIHARFIFATQCVLRKEFHAQLTEIVSLQAQSGSSCSFSLTEQRDLDANPLGSFETKKTLLCGMTNKQNTCSYKLLKAFSSTHKRWVFVTFRGPYVTKLVQEVAVQISVWGAQGNLLPLKLFHLLLPLCPPVPYSGTVKLSLQSTKTAFLLLVL